MNPASKRPLCFGVLERVFPLGPDGLRASPDKCMECRLKTQCLRAALFSREGLDMQMQRVDQAAEKMSHGGGLAGALRRWSHKKSLARRRSGRGGI